MRGPLSLAKKIASALDGERLCAKPPCLLNQSFAARRFHRPDKPHRITLAERERLFKNGDDIVAGMRSQHARNVSIVVQVDGLFEDPVYELNMH